jgi:hypothetical protein
MTYSEFNTSFKVKMDKLDTTAYPAFVQAEIDFWINQAIITFVKTRFSGMNSHHTGFQQDQKRTDDLRTLIVTYKIFNTVENSSLTHTSYVTYDEYVLEYPTNPIYWIGLGESVEIIGNNDSWPYVNASGVKLSLTTDVKECTIDNINFNILNPLSDYKFRNNKANPLRYYCDNKIYLYTDKNYVVTEYDLSYIKKPITFKTTALLMNQEYVDLPSHTHDEITTLAVKLALESISEPRYKTMSEEYAIME